MHPTASIGLRAARLAGSAIVQGYDRPDLLKISEKGVNDYVTNVDRQVENIIVETISKTFPDHSFLAEEAGVLGNPESEYQWIIDPLDGTRNFVKGIPHFCVSIACQHKGRLESAVIIDPIRQEEFTASRGEGAYLNSTRLRVSSHNSLGGSMLVCGGTDFEEIAVEQSALIQRLHQSGTELRQAGSACLDLAYIASGRLEAGWFRHLKPWDMAAGLLIVSEAGGLAGDFGGGSNHFKSGNLVAGSGKCFKLLLPMVKQEFSKSKA